MNTNRNRRENITRIFEMHANERKILNSAVAGDIVGLAGFEDVDIGDTLAATAEAKALPFVEIDPATVQMEFSVNDGPLVGKDGKKVTSRQIRERLIRETQSNISISIEDTDDGTRFLVNARGSMQIAVLVEVRQHRQRRRHRRQSAHAFVPSGSRLPAASSCQTPPRFLSCTIRTHRMTTTNGFPPNWRTPETLVSICNELRRTGNRFGG